MKGVVYTLFNRMIEERFGLPAWEQLLERAQLRSGGIYTAGAVYDDAELFALVRELEQVSGVEQAELVRTFGEYLIGAFGRFHPEMFTGTDTKSFLRSVDAVIHTEVLKLHPGALLPRFDYEDPGPGALVMLYRSPRGLCHLAEGLITGAAWQYRERAVVRHEVCMHRGADHCRLEIRLAPIGAAADPATATDRGSAVA
ncbi:MAG: heme NO-binding domain-containing protein [Steroidobacteraceae bacterium]